MPLQTYCTTCGAPDRMVLPGLGAATHVKERVLNQLTGESGGVVGVYDLYSYLPENRAFRKKLSGNAIYFSWLLVGVE